MLKRTAELEKSKMVSKESVSYIIHEILNMSYRDLKTLGHPKSCLLGSGNVVSHICKLPACQHRPQVYTLSCAVLMTAAPAEL